ncbi:MAG: Divergent polysaccharide deacetylase [Pelotomaculum sp. PtaB.Bin104]|nr:MAG: Divergent polysaccharide deacetylase [Pelotomaculum sp. PtaB.Bin104]
MKRQHSIIILAFVFMFILLFARVFNEKSVYQKPYVNAGSDHPLSYTFPFESQQTSAQDITPKIAIVIDDFGGADTTSVDEMLSINCPITVAVMPNLPNSREHALRASTAGFQVILHLPMEPDYVEPNCLGPGAIYCNLTDEEIKERLVEDLDSVPSAVGINNHTGSRATANRRVMKVVLEVAKEHSLFFLDSLTTNKSVVAPLSRDLGVPYVARNIFLDDTVKEYAIKRQIYRMVDIARKNGSAVCIGHV